MRDQPSKLVVRVRFPSPAPHFLQLKHQFRVFVRLIAVRLCLSVPAYEGPDSWRWMLRDNDGNFVGDHEVNLNAATGQLRWSYTTENAVLPGPAVAGGTVYVGSDDHKVYALNAATGQLRWSYTTGAAVQSDVVVAGGTVYVGSNDHKVYALNAGT